MTDNTKKDDFEFEIEGDEIEAEKPDLEIEDDTPEEDRGREPLPKEIVEELEKDELEDYSEKVKIRLKQMKKVWHDERREKERAFREQQEAIRAAQQLLEENKRLKSTLTQGEKVYLESVKSAAEYELAAARRAYKEAYEAGDTDKVVEAQEQLTNANYKLQKINDFRPPLQDVETEVQIPQQAVEAPRPDPKALAWQERNQWYGADEEMTDAALGLHQKLVKQYGGNYTTTDEYWQTIDNTMRRRFPEYFGEDKSANAAKPAARGTKPATVVAPASRSTSAKKVVLSKSQVAVAKRLGISPEQYARELVKAERN